MISIKNTKLVKRNFDRLKLLKQKKNLLENKVKLLKKIRLLKKIQLLKKKNLLEKTQLLKKKKISVGAICTFKINALSVENIGIDDRSKHYPVLIPNAKLGETVKAKILKINLKQNKYAIAKLIEKVKKSSVDHKNNLIKFKPGDIVKINIRKLNKKGAGIINLENNYKLIIPNAKIEKNPVNVQITQIKENYAFGHLINSQNALFNLQADLEFQLKENENFKLTVGSKFTIAIPNKVKKYGKYLILQLKGLLIFIKLNFKIKIGNKVRIKLIKLNSNFAIGKILQVNPTSLMKKQKLIKYSISQMLKNSVHLGEKASKCHAKMKNYIWLRKHQKNKKDQHTINLLKTHRCLNKALSRLTKYAFKGRNFLFIGTKQAAANLIKRASILTKTSFFVNTRWLGGMLTNWKTILNSICKIQPILLEKEYIVSEILDKRSQIKGKLIQKLYLRQKTIFRKLLSKKNQMLIKELKNSEFSNFLIEQLKNRKQIVTLINKLKEDKKSLKTLILEKQLEHRFLKYRTTNLNQNEDIKLKENEKILQLARNIRNHIKILLNFLFVKRINSHNEISKDSFVQLIKKTIKLIKGDLKEYSKLNNEKMDPTEKREINTLINAERNIKKVFKLLSEKKTFSSIGLNLKNVKQILLLKKLLKILPSLKRAIKISQTKLNQSVKIYMKKIIDLRLRRSFKKVFDYVYKDYLFANSKKLESSLKKKWKRLEKYLGGISNMIKLSKKAMSKNIAIVIGQREEMNAVRECKKLGLEMFHIVDTNCNPTFADHIIPANDDSKSSIKFILEKFLARIRLAQKLKKHMDSKTIKFLSDKKTSLKIKKTKSKKDKKIAEKISKPFSKKLPKLKNFKGKR